MDETVLESGTLEQWVGPQATRQAFGMAAGEIPDEFKRQLPAAKPKRQRPDYHNLRVLDGGRGK